MTNDDKLTMPYFVAAEEISGDAISAAVRILKMAEFKYSQIGGALHQAGVSWENRERAADRLLQRARKMGRVKHVKGKWRAIPEAWTKI